MKINLFGFFVNVGLLIATFFILNETRKSVQITFDALSDARISDSLNRVYQQEINDTAKARSDKEFKLREQSLDAQIQSLKTQISQFVKVSEPFLKVTKFEKYQPPKYVYKVANLGSYPVKIIAAKYFVTIRRTPPNYSEIYTAPPNIDELNDNKYVTRELSNQYGLNMTRPLTSDEYEEHKKGEAYIYLCGYYRYQNPVTKNIKFYRFLVELSTAGGVTYLKNDNTDK